MKTRALRLYGINDLRLEEFELPPIKEDEILAKVVSDSICMSSYKAAMQGSGHKRVPDNVAENPVIIGHEFCGEIVEVGRVWKEKFRPGERFAIQPSINYKGSLDAPGYSYKYIGGNSTYVVIPHEFMEMGCLLPFGGKSFFDGSLAEPLSCVIGSFHAMYHTVRGSYEHNMGIREGGKMAILGGTGPMGLAAIDYIIHCDRTPSYLVVTGRTEAKLSRAAKLLSAKEAAKRGITLEYKNTNSCDTVEELMDMSGGTGYDDVLVYAPAPNLIEQADRLLATDGCLNFFAGPTDHELSAKINFYNVHYGATHVVGTTGGNTADMIEALDMTAKGLLTPAFLVTHIGGMNSAKDAILTLPKIPGGKKLIYNGIDMPLTAISDFKELGKANPMFKKLYELTEQTNGLWNSEAEKYLLENME